MKHCYLSYDLPTKTMLTHLKEPSSPTTLSSLCRRKILNQITLQNLLQVQSLPLPLHLQSYVCTLSLADFLIRVDRVPPVGYFTNIYPAYCMLDEKPVALKLLQPEERVDKHDIRYITHFKDEGLTLVIQERSRTLSEVIKECRSDQNSLTEDFIWHLVLGIVSFIREVKLPPMKSLGCEHIFFLGSDEMFIEIDPREGNTTHYYPLSPIYDAPEIISRSNPDSRAHSWSIGCIIYECLALEPAFSDEMMNYPLRLFVNILDGWVPDEPKTGSAELKALMRRCLVLDKKYRITLEELCHTIRGNILQGKAKELLLTNGDFGAIQS